MWEVEITNATRHRADYYRFGSSDRPVQGEIAVRIVRDTGKVNEQGAQRTSLPYGTVKITDPEFDDKITTLKAEALERAATLNAVDAA